MVSLVDAKIKKTMQVERGNKCEECGLEGDTQRHHVVYDSMTTKGTPARAKANVKELCVLLCIPCHANAHNHAAQQRHFGLLVKRYGYPKVKAALDAVQSVSRTKLNIEIKEVLDGVE